MTLSDREEVALRMLTSGQFDLIETGHKSPDIYGCLLRDADAFLAASRQRAPGATLQDTVDMVKGRLDREIAEDEG